MYVRRTKYSQLNYYPPNIDSSSLILVAVLHPVHRAIPTRSSAFAQDEIARLIFVASLPP